MSEQEKPMSAATGAIKKKREDKHRKRDPRSWDNVKKIIANMDDEEKMAFIAEKYNEIYNDQRQMSFVLQNTEKHLVTLQKEKDREQTDLTKAILAKGHLESLCRELQKQNKAIKEENIARVKEEEERRREVTNNFTERLNALTNLMTESKDKSNKVKEENQSMTDKLTELYDQFQERENHLDSVTRQLELQKKLSDTTIKKNQIEQEAERQNWIREKKMLEDNLEKSENKVKILQENVKSLQAYVDIYKSQYADFETTMAKSNKVFDSFKDEMAKMNKQVNLLQAECNDWRSRWQSSANSLITLSEQHAALTNDLKAAEKKIVMLQKLCRQLQIDRATYIQQLKDNGIEPKTPHSDPENEAEQLQSGFSVSAESSQKKVIKDETIVNLKRDLRKIQDEVKEMTKEQSAAEREKLTAKEELLLVLKDELAGLQKECQQKKDSETPSSNIGAGDSITAGRSKKKPHKKNNRKKLGNEDSNESEIVSNGFKENNSDSTEIDLSEAHEKTENLDSVA